MLSAETDGVILVANTDITRRKELQYVVDQLRAIEANIVGVVPNRLNMADNGYYYRYYNYYQRPETLYKAIGGNGRDPEQSAHESTFSRRLRNRIDRSNRM